MLIDMLKKIHAFVNNRNEALKISNTFIEFS